MKKSRPLFLGGPVKQINNLHLWKLSLNPFLVKQDGKLFASEEDGTVIAYRYRQQTSRWEVFAEFR